MSKAPAAARVRCAIYTRVSTDHGLEQDFNSLDAQREAAEAYIKSQRHDGWTLVATAYDDGGWSGGSTERPALRKLLADVAAGAIDTVVVYKVDRLTRSLADFAKLVELFDRHKVSFVSVTQSFNTTTSMGRLTLNMLLSFAQFEREVTAERIRDKIGASKRRGIWVGGMIPLGYASRDKKLFVVEDEAARVNLIFRRYLELGSLDRLLPVLREAGVVTRQRRLRDGRISGGIPFTRGPLAWLLRNRFYTGEVVYKGEVCPGSQPPIVAKDLFEAVQARLTEQATHRRQRHAGSDALLQGRLFDDRGNRMTPSHAQKGGVRYRYYISAALLHGRKDEAGSVARVSATKIENAVTEAIIGQSDIADIERIVVGQDTIEITFITGDDANRIEIPWTAPSAQRHSFPAESSATIDPITRTRLVRAIALGRRWLAEIVAGGDAEAIAARECKSKRHVMMTLSLAYLSPDLVRAAIAGTLPRGISVSRLVDPPLEWARQQAEFATRSN